MDYLFEAIMIICAVVFPLSFVIAFLRELIRNLGDASAVTPLEEAPSFE
ncbi:hypothetical protein [Ectobacillus panaciterrae]|nr:hypothetical protein [Ectobacillus panaciterrae]